eukprot:11158675-Lingulodinium_polyedra.AAC.1
MSPSSEHDGVAAGSHAAIARERERAPGFGSEVVSPHWASAGSQRSSVLFSTTVSCPRNIFSP